MPDLFEPRIDILPPAQKEIWPQLAPAVDLSFVLYGGTAVALHLGHRVSIDFDFFRSERLDKTQIETSFQFASHAQSIQEDENTLVLSVPMPSGPVKISFFGGLRAGPDQRPASNKGFRASGCFARRPARYQAEGDPGQGRGQRLSRYCRDVFGRSFSGEGAGCVCQQLPKRSGASSQGSRLLQGR